MAYSSGFATPRDIDCEEYDGLTVKPIQRTKTAHWRGSLGLYNGQATAVGGTYAFGATESLTKDGWVDLSPHPR